MGPLQQYLNGPQFKWAPNNNIDPGGPGLFNLIFPTNLKMPPAIIFKCPQFNWAPNNNIDPGGPGPLNLIFANQFKNALNNNILMAPNLNGPPTMILIQGARAPSI